MFAAALIVFRETLEAALIVTIIMAATRGVAHRGKWISLGIAGGILGAMLIAALTNTLSSMFDGAGQEIVNASILFLAVALISWHIVWMNSHGRKLAEEMRAVGKSVSAGEKHLSILAIVVGLAVMREGSEIVLMLQGLWNTGDKAVMLGGGALGLIAGVGTGALMYAGFLALSIRRVFTLTNCFLALIAAGMAARGANFLTQADLLPSLGSRIWDTSAILSDQSAVGQLLAALVGYIARPSGVEVLFYIATVTIVVALMMIVKNRSEMAIKVIAIAALGLSGAWLFLPKAAHADEVMSPYVEQGEFEFENQGFFTHDRNSDANGGQQLENEIGYSPTSFYRVELESEFERETGPDQHIRYSSLNVENTFQLAEPGEYWIDPGAFFEMDFARDGDAPNTVIAGFLGAKTIDRFAETFNLLFHKDYGPNATPLGFIYSNQLKYLWRSYLQPGFEVFGDTAGKSALYNQQLGIGPGIFGKFHIADGQELKYELGYIMGATPATPDGAVRWKLEYEFFF